MGIKFSNNKVIAFFSSDNFVNKYLEYKQHEKLVVYLNNQKELCLPAETINQLLPILDKVENRLEIVNKIFYDRFQDVIIDKKWLTTTQYINLSIRAKSQLSLLLFENKELQDTNTTSLLFKFYSGRNCIFALKDFLLKDPKLRNIEEDLCNFFRGYKYTPFNKYEYNKIFELLNLIKPEWIGDKYKFLYTFYDIGYAPFSYEITKKFLPYLSESEIDTLRNMSMSRCYNLTDLLGASTKTLRIVKN